MTFRTLIGAGLSGIVLLVSAAAARSQGTTIYRKIAPETLETILTALKIEFQKKPNPADDTHLLYSFAKKNHRVVLHYYDGRDLMLMSVFDAIPLVAINEWNQAAKFSRAILSRDDKGEVSTVEANLDLAGGVTDDTIKHFIRRFDDDLNKYETHVARLLTRDEETFKTADSERLERILRELKIEFKKISAKTPGHVFFEFRRNEQKVRLHSFHGTDLMLAATFQPAALEKVNKYNAERKFVRAVLYQPADADAYTTLESCLDCQGGVTDGIIRYFIGTFADEMREFEGYLKK
jgi:hypothetical protein